MADFIGSGAVGRQRTGANRPSGAASAAVTGRPSARAGGDERTDGQMYSEGTEAAVNLPIPPAAFGLLALAGFAVLLLITVAFRNVSNRH